MSDAESGGNQTMFSPNAAETASVEPSITETLEAAGFGPGRVTCDCIPAWTPWCVRVDCQRRVAALDGSSALDV